MRVSATGRHAIVGLSLAILAAVGATGCSAAGSTTSQEVVRTNRSSDTGKALRINPPGIMAGRNSSSDLKKFPVFQTAAEGLPQRIEKIIGGSSHGMEMSLAQRIRTRISGGFWAVPSGTSLCVVGHTDHRALGASCTPIWNALRHGAALAALRTEASPKGMEAARLVVGVAPVHTEGVIVHNKSGSATKVNVRSGVFFLSDEESSAPKTLTLLRAKAASNR